MGFMPTSLSSTTSSAKSCCSGRVGHGVAAVFDDDGLAVELADVGQRPRGSGLARGDVGNVSAVGSRSCSRRNWEARGDAILWCRRRRRFGRLGLPIPAPGRHPGRPRCARWRPRCWPWVGWRTGRPDCQRAASRNCGRADERASRCVPQVGQNMRVTVLPLSACLGVLSQRAAHAQCLQRHHQVDRAIGRQVLAVPAPADAGGDGFCRQLEAHAAAQGNGRFVRSSRSPAVVRATDHSTHPSAELSKPATWLRIGNQKQPTTRVRAGAGLAVSSGRAHPVRWWAARR